MAGIAMGHGCQSEGLLFYCPHIQQFYASVDYKLDEGHNTPTTFNLHYEGGIFVGLYHHSPSSIGIEPYPAGTPVSMSINHPGSSASIKMRGTVISVPIPDMSYVSADSFFSSGLSSLHGSSHGWIHT
jgi:hypothetical protein